MPAIASFPKKFLHLRRRDIRSRGRRQRVAVRVEAPGRMSDGRMPGAPGPAAPVRASRARRDHRVAVAKTWVVCLSCIRRWASKAAPRSWIWIWRRWRSWRNARDRRYQPLRRFPTSTFDLSVGGRLCASRPAISNGSWQQAAGAIWWKSSSSATTPAPPLKEDRKSVTYRLTVGAPDHTLSSEEVAAIRKRVIEAHARWIQIVLVHVHGVAKVPDNPLGAEAASLDFLRIAAFTMQHLLVAHGHAAPTNPVLAVARVNMVEIGQTGTPLKWIRCQNIRSVARAIRNLIDLSLTPRSDDYGESM